MLMEGDKRPCPRGRVGAGKQRKDTGNTSANPPHRPAFSTWTPRSFRGASFAGMRMECPFSSDGVGPATSIGQCCICKSISSADGIIMFWLRSAMIHTEPAITKTMISTPKASASTLLVSSGPLVMCRKKTR